MILVNRLYTVFSVILIILVTVFYLIYISKYEKREYMLYMQNNSSYALNTTNTQYVPLYPFDVTTTTYNTNYNNSRVYLMAYEGYPRTGRFILTFSNAPNEISFNVITNTTEVISSFTSTLPSAYYPLYIDFHAPKDTEWIQLQYRTSQLSNTLYKLSIEFF